MNTPRQCWSEIVREEPIRPSLSPLRALKPLVSFAVRPAVLGLFAFALLIGTPAPSAEGATVDVLVGDFWFCSAGFQNGVCQTTITVGDTVSWDFSPAALPHTSTDCAGDCGSPPFGTEWDSGFVTGGGAEFQHTFNSTGVFLYYCSIHPLTMRGQITVTGAVGGVAELPALDGSSTAQTEATGATFMVFWAAGIAAAGTAVLGLAAVYARRRWLR